MSPSPELRVVRRLATVLALLLVAGCGGPPAAVEPPADPRVAAVDYFSALLRRTVLEPAGMADSTYEQPLPPERAAQAAAGHRPNAVAEAYGWPGYVPERLAPAVTDPAVLDVYTGPYEIRPDLLLQVGHGGDHPLG